MGSTYRPHGRADSDSVAHTEVTISNMIRLAGHAGVANSMTESNALGGGSDVDVDDASPSFAGGGAHSFADVACRFTASPLPHPLLLSPADNLSDGGYQLETNLPIIEEMPRQTVRQPFSSNQFSAVSPFWPPHFHVVLV